MIDRSSRVLSHEVIFRALPSPKSAVFRKVNILLADDEPVVRKSLVAVLPTEGYRIFQACDGLRSDLALVRAETRRSDHCGRDYAGGKWAAPGGSDLGRGIYAGSLHLGAGAARLGRTTHTGRSRPVSSCARAFKSL